MPFLGLSAVSGGFRDPSTFAPGAPARAGSHPWIPGQGEGLRGRGGGGGWGFRVWEIGVWGLGVWDLGVKGLQQRLLLKRDPSTRTCLATEGVLRGLRVEGFFEGGGFLVPLR